MTTITTHTLHYIPSQSLMQLTLNFVHYLKLFTHIHYTCSLVYKNILRLTQKWQLELLHQKRGGGANFELGGMIPCEFMVWSFLS